MKKILSIMLLAVFMLSMAAPAFAASYGGLLGKTLTVGSTTVTDEVKKTASGSAKVSVSTQTNGPKVWYRGRVGTNAADKATEAKSYTSKPSSDVSLPYLPGYGYVGNTYRLAIQNDSSSSASVKVKGTWTP